MEFSCDVRSAIDNSRDQIMVAVRKEAESKEYFQGLSLPANQFIDVIVKDYLEMIVLCYETGSMTVFREKLAWYGQMYGSRKQSNHPRNALSDFFRVIRSHVTLGCSSSDPQLEETLDKMAAVISEFETEGAGA